MKLQGVGFLALIACGIFFLCHQGEVARIGYAEVESQPVYSGGASSEEQTVLSRESDESETSLRVVADQTILPTAPELIECLRREAYKDCLLELDLFAVSPEQIAIVLESEDIPGLRRQHFLAEVLLVCEPSEALLVMDSVCQLMGDRPSENYSWFEGIISILETRDPFWVKGFVLSITPSSIYDPDKTDLLPLLFRRIDMDTPRVDQIIRDGGLGKWGGTQFQIERSFVVSMANSYSLEQGAALQYAFEGMESPFLSSEEGASVVRHGLFFVGVMGQRGSLAQVDVENYVLQALSHPTYQLSGARQFLHESRGGSSYGGLDPSILSGLVTRATEIVGAEQ